MPQQNQSLPEGWRTIVIDGKEISAQVEHLAYMQAYHMVHTQSPPDGLALLDYGSGRPVEWSIQDVLDFITAVRGKIDQRRTLFVAISHNAVEKLLFFFRPGFSRDHKHIMYMSTEKPVEDAFEYFKRNLMGLVANFHGLSPASKQKMGIVDNHVKGEGVSVQVGEAELPTTNDSAEEAQAKIERAKATRKK